MFEAVLPLLNDFARIPVCGLISHYNATESEPGPDRLPLMMQQILTKRLTLRGFIVGDFASQLPQFLTDMGRWVRDPFGNLIEIYSHSYELTYSSGAYQDTTTT